MVSYQLPYKIIVATKTARATAAVIVEVIITPKFLRLPAIKSAEIPA
ncbi:MAG: hypothetical protein HAW58_05840 [Candidatus Thioglobus sp.]|nr:hypothetical protein [Candidatus Thioglobus sp.]